MKPYRIMIAWNGEQFQGASMQAVEGDQFRFVPDAAWPALCATINTDALATIDAQTQQYAALDAELVAVKAELVSYKAKGVQAAQAVLAAPDKETCALIAVEILKNKKERDIAAADIAAAEAIAYAAALRAQ